MMIRRLALLATATVAVVETYRRGYTSALLFGVHCWVRARPDWCYQPERIG